MASSVPRFTSFRPKPKATTDQLREPGASETIKKKPKEKAVGERRKRSPTLETSKRERDADSSKPYFSDRRGDSEVLRYGAPNRYDVPAYRRYGNACVLGLDLSQRIDHERSSDTNLYVIPATGKRHERLLTDKRAGKESCRALRFVKASNTQSEDIQDDYIPISSTKRHEDSQDEAHPISEPDYRRIERNASQQPPDEDTQFESEVEGVDFGSDLNRKNFELVRQTRDHPEEIRAWLNLIDHQEAMLLFDHPSLELNDAMKSQLAETRISLFEEGLKKVGDDPSKQIPLSVGLFKEARLVWDAAKLDSRWKTVLAKYPQSTELWFTYLDSVQSNFARFKYEGCRATFLQCLEAIQNTAKSAPLEVVLHVFLRMTRMMHEAGYQELALAIWQALLELHVLQAKARDLGQMEEFWESEVPRIGEPATLTSAVLLQPNPSDITFEDFRTREADCIEKLRYPGRTSDPVGEDDAFHTIFFADIVDYLKILPTTIPKVLIIEAFLCFCSLPPLPLVSEHQQRWWKDPFLQHQSSRSSTPDYPRGLDQVTEKLKEFTACPLKSMQMSTETLIDQDFSLDRVRLQNDFVRRIIQPAISYEVIGEYLLAFELRHFPSDVVKTAKQLLKNQPSSQKLYRAYGLVESHRVKFEKADQVFGIAMSLGKTIASYESLELYSSWVWEALRRQGGQIEALWRLTSRSGQLKAREDPQVLPDKNKLLQTRAALSGDCEQALLRQDYPYVITSTALLAMLTYLSNANDNSKIDMALAAHQNLSDWFISNKLSCSIWAELHAQEITRLLHYHVTHAAIIKPVLIRNVVEPLIAQFPDNTILLSLYAANEARFAIHDRVRGIMQHTALKSLEKSSVAGWSFAIHFETLRGEVAGSTSHSIRALYKHATDPGSSGAHCPALWTSCLEFELAQLQLEEAKTRGKQPSRDGKKKAWENRLEEAKRRVKETFYQGLRNLPWCKDFGMLAFTNAKDAFTEEELWKVYRVMQEKELRMYVEFE